MTSWSTCSVCRNADRIRDGTSDKLGVLIQAISCALTGLVCGFALR